MKHIVHLESFIKGLSQEFQSELLQHFEQLLDSKLNSLSIPEETEWLSRSEAAEFLGCSLPTISAYQKQGLIPYYRIGRKIYFKKSELIESNQIKRKEVKS